MKVNGICADEALIRSAAAGDKDARQELVIRFAPLIRAIASRYRHMAGADLDDLIQAGTLGMLRALVRYSLSGRAAFATYAFPWILGEVRRAAQDMRETMCGEEKRREIARREREFYRSRHRPPTIDELAQSCAVSVPDLLLLKEKVVSIDESRAILYDCGADKTKPFDAVLMKFAIDSLTPDERAVVLLRYFRDYTQKETAALSGKSQAQVSRIERRALDRIREALS